MSGLRNLWFHIGLCIVVCCIGSGIFSQSVLTYSDSLNSRKLATVIGVETVGTAGTLLALNSLWYAQYSKVAFHTFNDNPEWLQVDKLGHALTSYYIGYAGIEALKWSGVNDRKAIWLGGGLGFVYLTGLEIMDGFSSGWGFSGGDMIANAAGMTLVIGQGLEWNEQRIRLKYSAHHTEFASYRPTLLGSNGLERLLKDYNGQTYGLSVNIKSFLFKEKKFPTWLNLAFGYSADEMISGSVNPEFHCMNDCWCNSLKRYRQWYLSFDVDLSRIKIKSKLLKTVLGTFGFIKIPAPALELSKNGINLKPFYF
jgi:hypothetical protein